MLCEEFFSCSEWVKNDTNKNKWNMTQAWLFGFPFCGIVVILACFILGSTTARWFLWAFHVSFMWGIIWLLPINIMYNLKTVHVYSRVCMTTHILLFSLHIQVSKFHLPLTSSNITLWNVLLGFLMPWRHYPQKFLFFCTINLPSKYGTEQRK